MLLTSPSLPLCGIQARRWQRWQISPSALLPTLIRISPYRYAMCASEVILVCMLDAILCSSH